VKHALLAGLMLLFMMISSSVLFADDQTQKDNSQQELLDRIDTLEKELQKLEDESKARKSLEVTEEEKGEQEKEVLEAVSREYTLSPQGTLSIDYSLSYSYAPTQTIYTTAQALQLQTTANHTFTNSIYTSYSIRDDLTTSLTLPIVYRYDKVGTDQSLNESDIGDMSLGFAFQLPRKLKIPGDISSTYSFGVLFPTGRSPYKINSNTELSTGSGEYSLSLGGSFSKQVDPVVVFWSLGIGYPLGLKNLNYQEPNTTYTLDKVKSPLSYSLSMGMGYALSYANSINMSFNYQYAQSTTLYYKELTSPVKTGDSVAASFGVGMGFMVTPKTTASVSLAYSLLNTGFSLTTRIPFDFVL
jgi:hypothetical protein